jgi:hypothetical protein
MGGAKVRVGKSAISIAAKPKTVDAKTSPHYKKRGDQRAMSDEMAKKKLMPLDKNWMSKDKQKSWPDDGDYVGIRANLGLLKSQGELIKSGEIEKPIVVQTIHKSSKKSSRNLHGGERGTAINYGMAFTVKDASFRVNQRYRADIFKGQTIEGGKVTKVNKFPMASVNGAFVAKPNEKTMFDGIEVRFNPKETHLFVDPDGRPIKFAEEATIVGTRVYVRGKIEYYDADDYPQPVDNLPTDAQLAARLLTAL